MQSQFFWLHIKKSAGISTRKLLHPYYTEVNRVKKPPCFIQSPPDQWNDILNNFRVPLGDYQFRRSLFAKTYLYPDTWDKMITFAFSREPLARCESMFFYLFWGRNYFRYEHRLLKSIRDCRSYFSPGNAFDAFLDVLEQCQTSQSNFLPYDLHFRTHTTPMWPDVVDEGGKLILSRIYRLDCLHAAIQQVLADCNLPFNKQEIKQNVTTKRVKLSPTKSQKRKIEALFAKDFELYENDLRI